jgi:hypothetical protein
MMMHDTTEPVIRVPNATPTTLLWATPAGLHVVGEVGVSVGMVSEHDAVAVTVTVTVVVLTVGIALDIALDIVQITEEVGMILEDIVSLGDTVMSLVAVVTSHGQLWALSGANTKGVTTCPGDTSIVNGAMPSAELFKMIW